MATTCATRRIARCTGLPTAGEGPADAAARAVTATRGRVLTFEGRVIQALFHADCGGHTAAATAVWGGTDAPYLESVADAFCARRPASAWTFDAEDRGHGARAERGCANPDWRPSPAGRVASRDSAGRALAVTVIGSTTVSVRAEVFRAVMTRAFGPRSIRSTWFEVVRDGLASASPAWASVTASASARTARFGASRPARPRPKSSPTTSPAPCLQTGHAPVRSVRISPGAYSAAQRPAPELSDEARNLPFCRTLQRHAGNLVP